MRELGGGRMGRWVVAAALLLFGLLVSGLSCPPSNLDHLPARSEARAVSAQQSLKRVARQEESAAEHSAAVPLLLLLLLRLAEAPRRAWRVSAAEPTPKREASLWLVPYLFRPPPATILVR